MRMSSMPVPRGARESVGKRKDGVVRLGALALVWAAVASGAVVFTEPAPVDLLMCALAVALPMVGLVRVTRGILALASAYMLLGAAAMVATIGVELVQRAVSHTIISLYLYVASVVLAAFVAIEPRRHGELVLNAYVAAAVVAGLAGIVGYFGLVPGTEELLTKFGRARGTFKDPNVLGAFLVPAAVFLVYRMLTLPLRSLLPTVAAAAIVTLALLLSFSRGAWFNFAVAVIVFGALTLLTSDSNRERLRLVALACAALLVGFGAVVVALQSDAVGKLLSERASMTQNYDVGPEGRFGGQQKAIRLILDHPLGLGAQQFTPIHHHEEPHNVYLNMHLNAGWMGGLTFACLMLALVVLGARHAFNAGPERGIFIVAYASLVGVVIEGAIIDSDHWRHLYVLISVVTGMMCGATSPPARILQKASESRFRNSRGQIGDISQTYRS